MRTSAQVKAENNENDTYQLQLPIGSALDKMYDQILGVEGSESELFLMVSTPKPTAYRQDIVLNQYSSDSSSQDQRLQRFDRFGDFHTRALVNSREFYDGVYSNYGDKYREELIQDLMQIDTSLDKFRVSQGMIRDANQVYATWRIFDGGVQPFFGAEPNWRWELENNANPALGRPSYLGPPSALPLMRMNRAPSRAVQKLKVEEYLEAHMQSGNNVFEIGKFSASGSPDIRERVVKVVELQWLNLANRHPNAVFVAHVMSLAHARLYKKYGFDIAEEFSVPGQTAKEYVLLVPGWKFAQSLLKVIGVTETLKRGAYPKWYTPTWYQATR